MKKDQSKPQQIGRLAIRHEGENWNAYYALPDSMHDPVFLGSIRMGVVIRNREVKNAFVDMMRHVVSDSIEDQTGVRPSWGDIAAAPEHERAGNG